MSEFSNLKDLVSRSVLNAKMAGIDKIEVPEAAVRIYEPKANSVTIQDVRVFVEGTMEKTLAWEQMSQEERVFGKP